VGSLAWGQDQADTYEQAMLRCDEAKRAGDFPAMALAIRQALMRGPGTEYAWRSLAWALNLSGQWEDSLGVARANVARNGATAWPLEQLAESCMSAGDFEGAREALAQADKLPPDSIGNAAGALDGTRRRLLDLTGQRRYELHWEVDLGQGGPGEKPARLLMPRQGDPRQTFNFVVRNAVSCQSVTDGPRDFIDVVQKPGEPFHIDATVTIRAYALGGGPLAQASAAAAPPGMGDYLGPFMHGEVFDPASPLCSRIAGFCRGASQARTVQNLMTWQNKIMHYEDTQNRTLDDILAGGQGVCHHFCCTFTALCRAAGVPARVAHGVVLSGEGEFKDNAGSHGWASVYLEPFGWVPVEPLDPASLRGFGRSNYLLTDYANHTPEDNHFAYTSIQGFKCDGRVVAFEPQP
jgi:hypothetical protein